MRAAAEADASANLTALRRYDNTGLRLWLNEITIPSRTTLPARVSVSYVDKHTAGPAVRQEIVDRLLELNHTRYTEEK